MESKPYTSFELCAFADEADPSVAGQIEALRANGIGLLEIRGVDGKNVSSLTASEARELKTRLADSGISVWSVGSPVGKRDIHSPASEEQDRFLRVLDTAVLLGAENIRLFSFYGTDGSASCLGEVCERLGAMLEAAEGSGVTLCHENEKGIFGDVPERCRVLHEQLPSLKAVFDPANFLQCSVQVLPAYEILRPYVKYAHVKDVDAEGRLVPAGEGESRFPELLKLLADDGVRVLTLEPHLKVFDGFSGLERDAVLQGRYVYASGREAFDCAASALRAVIC